MKKLIFKLVLLITLFCFVSCQNKKKNTENKEVLNELEFISPNGFEIAHCEEELIQILDLDVNTKIVKIEFLESLKASTAFVYYKENKKAPIKNIALAKGMVNYSAKKVKVGTLSKSKTMKVTDVIRTYTCSGDANCIECKATAKINPDGTQTIYCSKECCTLTLSISKTAN